METTCGYLDDKVMWVSTDERRWINRLIKIAKEHPDEVTVVRCPEENNGFLYLNCPANYLKISPPSHRTMSDEQRTALSERPKLARKTK